MSHEKNIEEANDVVFEHWVETGDGMTISEIARAIGCTTNKLRASVVGHMGVAPGCNPTTVRRERFSKSFGESIGFRQVDGWKPSEREIRDSIKRLQARAGAR